MEEVNDDTAFLDQLDIGGRDQQELDNIEKLWHDMKYEERAKLAEELFLTSDEEEPEVVKALPTYHPERRVVMM